MSFCENYWLKKQGRFKGLCFANSLIARDEGLHAEGSVTIYKHLNSKLDVGRVNEAFNDAVTMQKELIRDALPVSLIGIYMDTVSTYTEYIAEFWLDKLGYSLLFNPKKNF